MTLPVFKLHYANNEPAARLASLEALKGAMLKAIGAAGDVAIEASNVQHVDGQLIQLMTVIAHSAQKKAIPFAVLNPPIDLVMGFDKLGIDWRGLGINFRET